MAYITTDTVKDIRNALKAAFPEIKFSVTRQHHSSVAVCIMKSPYFENGEYRQINHFYIDQSVPESEEARDVVKRIDEIIRKTGNHYDNSDGMIDYFDVAFYYDISVGKYDKSHQKVEA